MLDLSTARPSNKSPRAFPIAPPLAYQLSGSGHFLPSHSASKQQQQPKLHLQIQSTTLPNNMERTSAPSTSHLCGASTQKQQLVSVALGQKNGDSMEPPHLVRGRDCDSTAANLDETTGDDEFGGRIGSGDSGNTSGGANHSRSSRETKHTQKSTADDWFNVFNKNVGDNNFSAYDDDPPYYIPNLKGRTLHVQGRASVGETCTGSRGPIGFRGIIESADDSNSDSFRSVIDDLTIQNRELKRRLKKLQGQRLEAGKLFELRINHLLSIPRKRKLEQVLQHFASTGDDDDNSSGNHSAQHATPSTLPSTIPSCMNNTDSGYTTNSRSGTSSLTPSSFPPGTLYSKIKGHHEARSSASGQSASMSKPCRSSLVDSEKDKMREVVKRLEQLFTGRRSTSNILGQPQQQQCLSNIAAQADRDAKIHAGEEIMAEGTREVSMMSPTLDIQNYTPDDLSRVTSQTQSLESASDQRPTRPLDLDPQRAQVAEENIEYLAHLTSSGSKENTHVEGQGVGWVYLNLIINLAQLHTINVTVPFIKKAIATISSKLELSPDGKMVRWKGGCSGTRFSNDGSRDSISPSDNTSPEETSDSTDGNGLKKVLQSDLGRSADPASSSSSDFSKLFQLVNQPTAEEKFHYRPIFARRSKCFGDDDSSISGSESSGISNDEDDSFDEEAGVRSEIKGRKRGLFADGPIIYYEGGNFCTDLSTQDVNTSDRAWTPEYSYDRFTENPIGEVCSGEIIWTKTDSLLFSPKVAPSNVSDYDTDDVAIHFSPKFSKSLPMSPPSPMELEVSGIGGVVPDDNFAINVQTRHYLLPKPGIPLHRHKVSKSRLMRKIFHRIPKSSIDVFHDETFSNSSSETSEKSEDRHFVHHELLFAKTLNLPPSSLPPAGYMFLTPSDESSSMGSDSGVVRRSSNSDEYFSHPRNTGAYNPTDDDSRTTSANGAGASRSNQETDEPVSSASTSGDPTQSNSNISPNAAAVGGHSLPITDDDDDDDEENSDLDCDEILDAEVPPSRTRLKRSRESRGGSSYDGTSDHPGKAARRTNTSPGSFGAML